MIGLPICFKCPHRMSGDKCLAYTIINYDKYDFFKRIYNLQRLDRLRDNGWVSNDDLENITSPCYRLAEQIESERMGMPINFRGKRLYVVFVKELIDFARYYYIKFVLHMEGTNA
jgi:hypothetical protein